MSANPPVSANPVSLPTVSTLSFWRRFHVRMSSLYGGVVFFVLTLMGCTFYYVGVKHQMNALQSRLRTAAVTLSHEIRPETVLALNTADDRDKPEYTNLIALFKNVTAEEPQFVSIYVMRPTAKPHTLVFAADYTTPGREAAAEVGEIYDARQAGKLLDGFERPTTEDELTSDKWGMVLSGYAPIRDSAGKSIAMVGVDIAADDVEQLKRDVRNLTLGVFGFAGICILILAWFVGGRVRKPLGRITDATTEIAAGRLETRVQFERDDEFGILARHLDQMAAGLGEREFIRTTFGRFVSEEVARHALSTQDGAALGGEERLVTVMLTDLTGYSTLSEKLSPADVVRMLNTYFSIMGEVIDRHQGCLIEFTGDGLLCVFGAPNTLPDHAEQAVHCAIEMQAALAQANHDWETTQDKRWRGQGAARLRMRIGIQTGPVIAGNIGTKNRVKYSVIGDAVNVAARIEQLSKELGTETLLTEDTLMRIPEVLRQKATARGEHHIKGRARSVQIYSV